MHFEMEFKMRVIKDSSCVPQLLPSAMEEGFRSYTQVEEAIHQGEISPRQIK